MTIHKVIVNASPLITLFNSQLAYLLPQLFEAVEVPSAVWKEVTAYKTDIAAQSLPLRPGQNRLILLLSLHRLLLGT